MSRPRKLPAYGLHKASGQARIILNGRQVYLGPHGSPESHEKYARLIAENFGRTAAPAPVTVAPSPKEELTVNEVLLRYLHHARDYYSKDGQPTQEYVGMTYALQPLRRLYGRTPAAEFGPKKLKALRNHQIEVQDLCRNEVNKRIGRVKRVFKWAVSEELVPPSVHHGLSTVRGLSCGRSKARETEPVKPIPVAFVQAVLPHVSPPVAAMIQVQLLAAMRPCEVVLVRACDIDTSGEVWIYEPMDHKNRWRGHRRPIALGPKVQEIIRPFLTTRTEAFLFSPKDAEEQRNAERRRNRKSPMTPSQAKRKPKKNRQRPARERYDVNSYRRAITYGVKRANRARREGEPEIPHWSPLQLRHTRATELRRQYGIEGAQVTLGHARADVTQVYAERDMETAIRIAREVG